MYISVGAAKRFYLTANNSSSSAKGSEEIDIGGDDKHYQSSHKEFHVIEKSPCSNFFLTLSQSSLHLWSLRPTILLSQVDRTEESLERFGLYVNALWKPDCSHVVALTSKGYLHIFNVVSPQLNSSLLQYSGDHQWATGPGQAKGAPNYLLTLKISAHLKQGIRCLLPMNQFILVSTVDEPSTLFMVTWSGEKYANQREALDLLDSLPPSNVSIVSICHDRSMDLYGFILSDNSILLSLKREHFTPDTDLDGSRDMSSSSSLSPESDRKVVHFQCIDRSNVAEVQMKPLLMVINARHRLICIGTSSGASLVYHLNNEFQLFFSHKIPKPPTFPDDIHISTMAWTSDGNSIALGYSFGGFAIATAFGRITFSTTLEELMDPEKMREEESYLSGVSKMFWGLGNFDLFVLPKKRRKNSQSIEIYSIPFAKYAILTCNIRDNMRHPFLIGDNQLLLHSGTDVDSSPFSVNSTVWQVVQIPNLYITENWPVKYAAASSDGKRVAVAGRRGFAISNLQTGKWKLFGNQQQEKGFMCLGGLLWFKDLIVIACQTTDSFANELRVYPSSKNLENSNVLYSESFPRRIILLNILYHHLLVYTADNQLHHYRMEWEKNIFKIRLVERIKIHCVKAPLDVQYIDWFVAAVNEDIDESIRYSSLVLLTEGKLSLVDRHLQNQSMLLSKRIEFCWPYFPKRPVGDLFNIIWAFDGSKAKIWFNLLLLPRDQFRLICNGVEDFLSINLDFYPMSVLFHKGIIVGVEQSLSTHYVDGISFKSIAKSCLFLQDIIYFLLKKKYLSESLKYAIYYQDYDYFGHAMEILVHRVLEKEAETLVGFSKDAILPLIIEFLRKFPHFYDVIVSCSRKTEVALWEYLFSIVGDPKELFNKCIDSGNLKTATSFLIIIQTLEPFSVSSKLQVELLEKTLEAEDFELCGEIVRYLNSVAFGRGQSIDLGMKTGGGTRTGLLAISLEEEQTFYIDILISRHARRLLQTKRIRTLGKLSQSLNFPLEEWLTKERYRSALIPDMKSALRELHNQFEWPFPTDQMRDSKKGQRKKSIDESSMSPLLEESPTLRRRTLGAVENIGSDSPLSDIIEDQNAAQQQQTMNMISKRSNIDSMSRSSSFGELLFGGDSPKMTPKKPRSQSVVPRQIARRLSHRGDLEQEIRSLLAVTKNAKCFGWALLLATMVLDLGVVVDILQESRKDREFINMFDEYKATLISSGSLVYQSFVSSVEEVVGLT